VFLLLVNFFQFLTWKIWFTPISRIFHEKMDPNLADIEFFFLNCQIWLNPDYHKISWGKNI
jgi:hypothetical protein